MGAEMDWGRDAGATGVYAWKSVCRWFWNIPRIYPKPLFSLPPSTRHLKETKPKPKNQPKTSPKPKPPTEGGSPYLHQKIKVKMVSATGEGGLVFVTKNHHKNGLKGS